MKNIFGSISYIIFSLLFMFFLFIIKYEYQISQIAVFGVGLVLLLIIFGVNHFIKKNKSVFYILIYKNKIVLRDVLNELETDTSIEKQSMSASSLVVKNYGDVEKTLKEGFNKHFKQVWYKPRPIVFIHAMGTKEGELSKIEFNAFLELAFSIGASKAFVITGLELHNDDILETASNKT